LTIPRITRTTAKKIRVSVYAPVRGKSPPGTVVTVEPGATVVTPGATVVVLLAVDVVAAAVHTLFRMVLLSSVTAPLRASSYPVMDAPVFAVILVSA
jgi:hypothetical protein